jgi:hypothetical protein
MPGDHLRGPLKTLRRSFRQHLSCKKCGYDLFGLETDAYGGVSLGEPAVVRWVRCPECGSSHKLCPRCGFNLADKSDLRCPLCAD